MGSQKTDLVGLRFGRLQVISDAGCIRRKGHSYHYYQCRCDCGSELLVMAQNLARGYTNSCGCLRQEMMRERMKERWKTNRKPKVGRKKAMGINMKIQDIHIGQRVRDIETKWEMTVVGVGVLNLDMDGPYVYCDFVGNEGEMWEYDPKDLEAIEE